MIGIYAIENKVSGKKYVGSSNNIKRRFREHKLYLRKGTHKNRHLQFAWNKYGEDAFRFAVLIQCPKNMLEHYEQVFMDQMRPEYNATPCAGRPPSSTGRRHSEETKRKISLAGLVSEARKLFNKNRKDKDIRSPETISKMIAANMGKKQSPESNAKRSAALKGIKRSAEFKAKVSAGQTARHARNKL